MGKTDGKGGDKSPSIRVRKEWKIENGILVLIVYLRAVKNNQSLAGTFHTSAFDYVEDKIIEGAGEVAVRFASIPASAPASVLTVAFNGENDDIATFTEPITVGSPVNLVTYDTPVVHDYVDAATAEHRLRVTVVGYRGSGVPAVGQAISLSISGHPPQVLYLGKKGEASTSFGPVESQKTYDVILETSNIGSQTWTVEIASFNLEFQVQEDCDQHSFTLSVNVNDRTGVKPVQDVEVYVKYGKQHFHGKTDVHGALSFPNLSYEKGKRTRYAVLVEGCAKFEGKADPKIVRTPLVTRMLSFMKSQWDTQKNTRLNSPLNLLGILCLSGFLCWYTAGWLLGLQGPWVGITLKVLGVFLGLTVVVVVGAFLAPMVRLLWNALLTPVRIIVNATIRNQNFRALASLCVMLACTIWWGSYMSTTLFGSSDTSLAQQVVEKYRTGVEQTPNGSAWPVLGYTFALAVSWALVLVYFVYAMTDDLLRLVLRLRYWVEDQIEQQRAQAVRSKVTGPQNARIQALPKSPAPVVIAGTGAAETTEATSKAGGIGKWLWNHQDRILLWINTAEEMLERVKIGGKTVIAR